MWSGLHPISTGLRWKTNTKNVGIKIRNQKTLFEVSTSQGYYNYATGKIHHNGHQKLAIFENIDGSSDGALSKFGANPK